MSKTGGGGGGGGEGGQQIKISVGEITFVWVIKIQSPHSENSFSGAAGEGTRMEESETGMQEKKRRGKYVYTKLPRSQTALQVFQPFQKMEFFSSLIQPQKPLLSFFSATEHSPQICFIDTKWKSYQAPCPRNCFCYCSLRYPLLSAAIYLNLLITHCRRRGGNLPQV